METRGLTIKGKIAIVKAKALPLITYVTNFIYVPKDVIETIDKLLYEFVWKKKHHVKRSTLIEKIAKGGLKMPDTAAVIKSNKLNLIKRLINTENDCNTTAAFILKTNDVERFLTYKNNIRFLQPLPQFYKQLLDMWYSINNVEPETISEVLNESIWLNKRIFLGNVPIHNKTWITAGILTIKDCLNGNPFMSQAQLMGKYKVPCDFLFYNGLRSSIIRRWLDPLATTNNIDKFIVEKPQSLMVKLNNKYVELRKVTCGQFYWSEIKIISENQHVILNGNRNISLLILTGIL